MENKTIKNLIVLGIAVFSLILVNKVSAYYNPYDSSYWLEPVSDNSIEDYTDYSYEEDYYGNVYPSNNYNRYRQYDSSSSTTSSSGTRVVNNYYYQTAPASSTSSKVNTSSTTKTYTTSDNNKNNSNAVSSNGTGYYNGGYNYGNGMGASAYDAYYYNNGYSNQEGSKITALSWKGSGSFMPSSVWQWILVVMLILVIIIISRLIVHKRTLVVQEAHASHVH